MEINTRPSEEPIGPARVPHQFRQLDIKIELTEQGLRISTPAARGWAVIARTREQVGFAVDAAFTEAQAAAYAKAHGQAYDLDVLTSAVEGDPMAPPRERQPRPRMGQPGVGWSRGQRRPDQHDPAAWARDPTTGDWMSPSGRRHRQGTQAARRIEAARRRAGLPD